VADSLDPARQVKPCRPLVGQRFVLYEAILAGRLNGLLVQTHCVRFPPFHAGRLGGGQRRAVGEILGAVFRPHLKQAADLHTSSFDQRIV
jgi:hypothetical protein